VQEPPMVIEALGGFRDRLRTLQLIDALGHLL
jgi:hypothetical protein